MTMKRRWLWLTVVLVSICGSALMLTPLGQPLLDRVFAVGQVPAIDFASLRLGPRPNQFLMCPPDTCAATGHAESPVFEVSAERLRERWREVVSVRQRVDLVAESTDGWQLDYVARSARFRFPDLVTVRFVSLSPERSTLAIYSRALYGRRDFGVNRARTEGWLAAIAPGL
jgi:uncharacterized protein (DUF1499 family)